MSQRVDERDPTRIDLDCYNKVLELTDHVISVCKQKDKNVNNKHIPKKNASIGKILMDAAVEIGADILEANEIYVGSNLHPELLKKHYTQRRDLQEHAIRMSYRVEHVFRVLHFDTPFAPSTNRYMMKLLTETRKVLIAWRDSDFNKAKQL